MKNATPRILGAGQRAGGAEEARSHHQAARHVVGPFDRRIEQETQQHRNADHQEIGDEQDRGNGVAHDKQRGRDPVTAAFERGRGD